MPSARDAPSKSAAMANTPEPVPTSRTKRSSRSVACIAARHMRVVGCWPVFGRDGSVVAFVKDHPILRRQHFWHGQYLRGSFTKDLAWLRPDGLEMLQEDWEAPESHCVGVLLAGEAYEPMPAGSERLQDDTLLIVLNAQPEAVPFVLPALQVTGVWEVVLCTDGPLWHAPYPTYEHQECYTIPAWSLSLLQYARGLHSTPLTGCEF